MEYISDSASSPLSFRSKSPSPPCDYPSPCSTQQPGSRSTSKPPDSCQGLNDRDGPPPKKRRKLTEQKTRTTSYLDLRVLDGFPLDPQTPDGEASLQRLLKALRKKQKIVVIAGAGISVSAGIPDFRSSTGLFKTLRDQHKLKVSGKHLFDAAVYKSDSSTSSFHDMIRELSQLTRSAEPTLFHHMLATLAEEGRLLRLYTQNIDGIDTSLPPLATDVPLNPKGPWPKTIQLHGGLEIMVCTKCGDLRDFDGQLFQGPKPPSCGACEDMESARTIGEKRSHGIGRLRPRIVLYNEFNPEDEAIGAVTRADLRSRPDAVIVVGTSLKVPGVRRIVREMCAVTRGRRDGFTAWISNGPEPLGNDLKDSWDLVVQGDCEDVARHVALPRWNDKDYGDYNTASSSCMEEAIAATKAQVVLEGKHKVVEKIQGILTPTASPRHQSPVTLKTVAQSKIPKLVFNGASAKATVSKAPKTGHVGTIKKKAGRPIGNKSVNKITSTFTVSKKATAKPSSKADRGSEPVVFPNLTTKLPPIPMRPLSPVDVRSNTDTVSLSHEHDSSLADEQLTKDFYAAIPSPHACPYKGDTISPKGPLPSNMAHLLEAES